MTATHRREDLYWRVGFFVLAAAAAFPIWWVDYLPLQDLPQHLAAIRILHDYGNPSFRFAEYFDVDLLRTQYLAYYVAADLLCFLFDVETANRILMTAFMVGLPYAAASLMSAQGRDPRFAVLVLPLSYNAHLVLGFFNFLAAIPLSLYGITLAARQRRQRSVARSVGIAAITLLCFYTHVVPFAFLCLGIAVVSLGRGPRDVAARLAPVVPAALAALHWTLTSPAGKATLTAAAGSDRGTRPEFQSFEQAVKTLPVWITDVLRVDTDRQLLWAWCALVIASAVIGLLQRRSAPDRLGASLGLRLALLAPLAAVAYFMTPTTYDWIWPIAQRFPLLAAIYLVAALPQPRGRAATAIIAGAALVSSWHFHIAGKAFADFDRREVGDFDAALQVLPTGSRVAGLIFSRHSRHVLFSPFIHYVAYYQARKGGAVMFSFADFPQSPFRFKDVNRPPRVRPRWEWEPADVSPQRDLQWYSHVIVRGGPGAIGHSDRHELIYNGRRWRVFKRID